MSLLFPELDMPITRVFDLSNKFEIGLNQSISHLSKLESFIKDVAAIADPGEKVTFILSQPYCVNSYVVSNS